MNSISVMLKKIALMEYIDGLILVLALVQID